VLVWWLPVVVLAGIGSIAIPAAHALPSQSVKTRQAGPQGQAVDAQAAFLQDCASCHGADAHGSSRGPSLQGVGMAAVDFYLSTGRMPKRDVVNKAPPYRPLLSAAVIAALDRYVTALAAHGGPGIPSVDPVAGDVGEGGTLFRENCASCHGWGGSGGELTDRPLPSVTEATPTQVAEAVRIGPSQMPRFGTGALSDRQLDSVAAYVATLKHPDDKGGNALSHLGPAAEGAVAWLVGMVALLGIIRWIGKRG
jgi:ubiquinol-cytochrome c reductase cytochrome c subunit